MTPSCILEVGTDGFTGRVNRVTVCKDCMDRDRETPALLAWLKVEGFDPAAMKLKPCPACFAVQMARLKVD